MNDPVTQYFAQSDSPSLTPEERSAVRFALQAKMAMALTPEEKTDIRRALQRAVYAEPAAASSWSWLSIRLPAMSLAAFLLLAASGGGLVYAAEYAVPGDMLYGIKIHLNEAFRAKLQVTPEDRAQWALERLERRMDELRRLSARGTSDEELDVALGAEIEATANAVQAEVEALPAAAAERAAARTAVNAAIGSDQDSLRRASKINRVLKALKERAEGFDTPVPAAIVPAPGAVPTVRVHLEGSASVRAGAASSQRERASSRAPASSRRPAESSVRAETESSAEASVTVPELPAIVDDQPVPPGDPLPGIDLDDGVVDTVNDAVGDTIDGLL